jgi:hypothetical protein
MTWARFRLLAPPRSKARTMTAAVSQNMADLGRAARLAPARMMEGWIMVGRAPPE